MELKGMLEWTLVSECSIPKDVTTLLTEEEKAIAAYKTFRDVAIFTNKRLIVKDIQGLTGSKAEVYSLPYSSILMWSTENAGIVDINSENIAAHNFLNECRSFHIVRCCHNSSRNTNSHFLGM